MQQCIAHVNATKKLILANVDDKRFQTKELSMIQTGEFKPNALFVVGEVRETPLYFVDDNGIGYRIGKPVDGEHQAYPLWDLETYFLLREVRELYASLP